MRLSLKINLPFVMPNALELILDSKIRLAYDKNHRK